MKISDIKTAERLRMAMDDLMHDLEAVEMSLINPDKKDIVFDLRGLYITDFKMFVAIKLGIYNELIKRIKSLENEFEGLGIEIEAPIKGRAAPEIAKEGLKC